MPTATLLIEIVIIGLFTNLNLLLLLSLFLPFGTRLEEVWRSVGAQEGAATLVIFVLALSSYVLGVLVNVSVSNLFDPIDDHIREEVFDQPTQAELKSIDAWIGREDRKASEIYHYMRYRLYDRGQAMKEQLDQHRSEIRILRATALNSYWLMVLLLCPPLSQAAGKLYGGVAVLLFITMTLLIAWNLPALQLSWIKQWKEENKKKFRWLYQGIFCAALVGPWIVAVPGGREQWIYSGGIAAGLVTVSSFVLWTKQQRRFYQALFHGFRALAVTR